MPKASFKSPCRINISPSLLHVTERSRCQIALVRSPFATCCTNSNAIRSPLCAASRSPRSQSTPAKWRWLAATFLFQAAVLASRTTILSRISRPERKAAWARSSLPSLVNMLPRMSNATLRCSCHKRELWRPLGAASSQSATPSTANRCSDRAPRRSSRSLNPKRTSEASGASTSPEESLRSNAIAWTRTLVTGTKSGIPVFLPVALPYSLATCS